MKSTVFYLFVALSLPLLLEATPLTEKKEGSNSGTVKRFLRDIGFSRFPRQSSNICNVNDDCLPPDITAAPETLVRCLAGECVCNDCFLPDDDTGRCRLCPDYRYDVNEQLCGNDNRKQQLTALLLSVFLSGVGAANFYIDQSGLAGGQLFLFIFLMVLSYSMCYIPCCLACCIENWKGSLAFIILMLILTLLVVAASIAMTSWWIADLVIFATNQRLSGNGCVLSPI